jgi:hypothetical protein
MGAVGQHPLGGPGQVVREPGERCIGTTANEIEGDDELLLRFSFALVVLGVEGGSPGEHRYMDGITGDYRRPSRPR